jgi:NADH dehydrogenase
MKHMAQERPRVVIVGAGFGGLVAAKTLARAPVDVTLIDRQNYHCFQPLLYQVATAALSPAEIAWPIRHILRQQWNATVLMADVTGVDAAGRRVETTAGPMPYDYLVIATGAMHSYFGHDEWETIAPGLKRIEDATRIRRSILLAFEQAELTHDDAERRYRRRRRNRRRNGGGDRRHRTPDACQ